MSFEQITSESYIADTYFRSQDSNASCNKMSGVDDITPENFRRNIHRQMRNLHQELRSNTYRHSKLKYFIIPRGNEDRGRVICTPTQKDKLVQRVLYRYLTENLDTLHSNDRLGISTDISYGLGKDFSQTARQAVNNIARVRRTKPYGVKTDISNFFNDIDRPMVISTLDARIQDPRILELLRQVIYTDIRGERLLLRQHGITPNRGLRQGMPLSPLLASALLVDFDNAINQNWFNAYRVADDILCLCSTEHQAHEILETIESRLQELSLTISPLQSDRGKTVIFTPDDTVKFLGIDIKKSTNSDRYLKRIPDRTKNLAFQKVRDIYSRTHDVHGTKSLSDRQKSLDSTIDGYKGYFQGCGNFGAMKRQMRTLQNSSERVLIQKTFGRNPFFDWNEDQRHLVGIRN